MASKADESVKASDLYLDTVRSSLYSRVKDIEQPDLYRLTEQSSTSTLRRFALSRSATSMSTGASYVANTSKAEGNRHTRTLTRFMKITTCS